MQTYQSHSDGRRSRAGRGPVQTAGKPLVSSGEAAFAIFRRVLRIKYTKYFCPLPMRHTPLASPGLPSSQRM